MKKYSDEDLKFIYKNRPNELANIFRKAGYTESYIINMLNTSSEDIVLLRVKRILMTLQSEEEKVDNNKYQIPIKYNVPEADYLKEDRENMYCEMNNSIDKKIGKILEQIYSYEPENYITCIHRTYLPKDQILNNIFVNGIEYGNCNNPYYADHVQPIGNFPYLLREIKYCESYKWSKGTLILKIPKVSVSKEKSKKIIPLYYKGKDGKTYLRPEYISAYVSVENRELKEIILNTKEHKKIYNPDTIFYTDELVDNQLKK